MQFATTEDLEYWQSLNPPCAIKVGAVDKNEFCPNNSIWYMIVDYGCCHRPTYACDSHYYRVRDDWLKKQVLQCRIHGTQLHTTWSAIADDWFRRI